MLDHHVHIHVFGRFTERNQGNEYVLMIIDQLTKSFECLPLPQQNAELTAKCEVDGFISGFACPPEIHTDRGKKFDSKLFASVCEFLQVTKTRTIPYRLCSNGQVGSCNKIKRANLAGLKRVSCWITIGTCSHSSTHQMFLKGSQSKVLG